MIFTIFLLLDCESIQTYYYFHNSTGRCAKLAAEISKRDEIVVMDVLFKVTSIRQPQGGTTI